MIQIKIALGVLFSSSSSHSNVILNNGKAR
jgi:hypothetical protein